jgi:hypothetical protein
MLWDKLPCPTLNCSGTGRQAEELLINSLTRLIMPLAQDEVDVALQRIKSAGFPCPSEPLLSSFVNNALNPQLAARYVNKALAGSEAELLVSDWTYIIIPTPLCPKACRTLNFLTVQENRALAGRVKSPYRRSRKNISD